MHRLVAISIAATALVGSSLAGATCNGSDVKVIKRDVAVIGGGASGSHAAVWFRDHGKSVVVVEKNNRLGGHTASWVNPETNKSTNIGVQGWYGFTDGLKFVKRMNVSFTPIAYFPSSNEQVFVDIATGQPIANFQEPDGAASVAALQRYHDIIKQYNPLVLPNYDNFPSDPSAIPEDLVMPFREFVEKYDLNAAVTRIWDATGLGLGNMMDVPTLFVIAASPEPFARALYGDAETGIPVSGRLADLYDAVAAFLDKDVLYSSEVVSSTRPSHNDGGVILCINTVEAGGQAVTTRIEASRLLISAEPTPENIAPLDMDATETAVLQTYKYATVYVGVIRCAACGVNMTYTARSADTLSSNYTVFPKAAHMASVSYIAGTQNLFTTAAVGTDTDTPDTLKTVVRETIKKIVTARGRPNVDATIEFVVWEGHGKMHARVSAEDLRNGFITKLTGLQGKRATWYTGAAFSAGFSTVLWDYNEVLLPRMLKSM